MQEQSTEQRLSNLENEVADLKQKLAEQIAILEAKQESASNIDRALLNRVDVFGSELQRFERETRRSFEELRSGQKSLEVGFAKMQQTVDILVDSAKDHKQAIDILVDSAKDHKQAIEELAAGQRQIISLLTGEGKLRND